jgi:N-methylhydantoinase B
MKGCQRLIDIVFEALNPFFPERAAAAAGGSGGTITLAWGDGPRTAYGNQHEILGSAYGGGSRQDGTSGTTVHLSNIYVTPIEIVETEFPCRITRFELIPDSGGAGERRGGLSFRREYEALQPALALYRGDRAIYPAKGYGGGRDGRPSRFIVNPGQPDEKFLPSSCRVDLKSGDRFRVEAAGGGGFGDPARRDPAAHAQDLEDGYVTRNPPD